MLISFSHRFIFFHVSKSAGTSIEHGLANYAHHAPRTPLNRLGGKFGMRRDPRKIVFPQHTTARAAQTLLPPEVFDQFFKFAIVRNPWDWIVSLYHYLRETPSHRHHKRVLAMKSLEEYIAFEAAQQRRTQHSFITAADGRPLVDFVGRYEFLADDFATVCRYLGVESSLPHLNATRKTDYRELHNPTTIERVAELWEEDVRLFGYGFDSVPDRPPVDKVAALRGNG
jgi:hypothetical protein